MAQTLPDVMDRIRWLEAPTSRDYFSLLALANVCLDTPHYSGMNISYDTFAVGTPIVTWPGRFMRGRYTAALYQSMEIDACVATELSAVSVMARQIGTDRAYRNEISHELRQRSAVLFENETVVEEFEQFFEQICHAM